MLTFSDIRYYYEQTVTSFAVQKSTEIITTVAFRSFHTLKQAAFIPAAITCVVIGPSVALVNLSLFGMAYAIELVSTKMGNQKSLGPHANPLQRLVFLVDSIAKYIVPKMIFFLTIAALSPYIIVAKSMDYIEDKVIGITEIALDTLGIAVELPISRQKLLYILNEWKGLGLTHENRQEACQKILDYYDRSTDLFDNLFSSPNSLYIEDCRLRSLPEIFHYKPFSTINTLSLNDNELDYLLPSIYNLPSTSQVFASHNQFSADEINTILNITNDPHYQGPIITVVYSTPEFFIGPNALVRGRAPKTLYDFYTNLCDAVGRAPQSLSNVQSSETLRSWLSRLSRVSDYRQPNESMKRAFITHIVTYLEEANRNPEFQAIFENIIEGASATCGDRVALSVLHIDIAYQLANIDSSNMRKLSEFLLRGCLAIDLLEECARQKIESLQEKVDQIEIYLSYPIALKKELDLPINQETMLYFDRKLMTAENLASAKDFVMSSLNNQDTCLTFLINHDVWIKALQKNNTDDFDAIYSKRERARKNATSEKEEIEIQEKYMQALKELSIQAIEKEDISPS